MATIQIITTGGTIAQRIDPATGGAVPAVGAEELVAQVPSLSEMATIRVSEFSLIPSWNMTLASIATLAQTVQDALTDPEVTGAVVTHGTDTMEETSFALDLVVSTAKPIVLTGAMRNASLTGADGPRNLLSAVQVAAARVTSNLGVLVVMNDEIHAARYVTKGHTTALDTFASRGVGPIGLVDDEGVWLRWRPSPLPHLSLVEPEGAVYLVKAAVGMDDLLLRTVLRSGGRGVVIEGSGAGHTPASWEPAISDLVRAGVPVVLVSRTGSGRITATYGGEGGGRALRKLGVIPGGDLTGPKARVALAFALGAGMDVEALRAWFAQVARNDEAAAPE